MATSAISSTFAPVPVMTTKSQYELDREANIAKNRALFEDLGLKQAINSLSTATTKFAKASSQPVQAKRIKRERPDDILAPRRQSQRLMKKTTGDLDETSEEKQLREEEEARNEEAQREAQERARQAKRPRHDVLNFKTLAETDSPQELSKLSATMQNVIQCQRRVPDPEAYAFNGEGSSQKEERALREIRDKVYDLKVVARAKVVAERIYCAAYHPEKTKDLIFFGDKNGTLGIWDARAPPDENDEDGDIAPENREGGKYWRLQLHWPANAKSSISSIKLDPIDSHNLYTSSYDCTVRSLSFVSGSSKEIFANEEGILISSIDLPPTGQELWMSDNSGSVTHVDLREEKSKARRYGLSDNKIGSVSVNPTRTHFLLTASNSRVMKIWDARKLQIIPVSLLDQGAQDTAMESKGSPLDFEADIVNEYASGATGKGLFRAEFPHFKSVSSAYWDPRGRQIVSTSYDDTLRLWDITSPTFQTNDVFPNLKPFCQIRHNCQTGKWVTILRAQWSQNPDVYPYFTVGNMNHALDIYSCKGDLITQLADRTMISAVQAVTCTHPSIVERAVSGNASGRVTLWAPEKLKDES